MFQVVNTSFVIESSMERMVCTLEAVPALVQTRNRIYDNEMRGYANERKRVQYKGKRKNRI